jgi:metal-responsive CopG/Arc/MetJ family transcriptional regulator
MENLTVRVPESLIQDLDEEAEEEEMTRSEYVRQILQERHETEELQAEVETLQDRVESREARIDTLEQQLSRRSEIEEKVGTLAKKQDEPAAPFFVEWVRWWRE